MRKLPAYWIACTILAASSALISTYAFAQSLPSTCDGVNYDCMAVLAEQWDYRRKTCNLSPHRPTEEEAFQDEIELGWGSSSICDLETERVGWFTTNVTIQYCGVLGGTLGFKWGIENWTISQYWFRYRSPSCNGPSHEDLRNVIIRDRDIVCPNLYSHYEDPQTGAHMCRRQSNDIASDKRLGKPKGECCGNPIDTSIANKYQEETDYISNAIGGLVFKRYYNSGMDWDTWHTAYDVTSSLITSSYALGYGNLVKLPFVSQGNQQELIALDSIGAQWRHHYQRAIYRNVTPSMTTAMVFRHDGQVVPFNLHNGSYVTEGDINDRLIVLPDGRYQFTDADDEIVETYLATGHLETIRHKNGMLHTVAYDSCMRIATATDQFGHSLQFNYQHDCSGADKLYRIALRTT